jgi:alpha-1,2-mannosyltransferase
MTHQAASSTRLLWIVGFTCGFFGVAAWGFWLSYIWAFHGSLGQDWMVFYAGARAYLEGNLPLISDGQQFTEALNQRFSTWLPLPLNLHPWVYPPSFLLLFLPFGLLPPAASFAVFQITGFVAALAAVLVYAGRGPGRWMIGLSLVLCPAVPFNVITGQNGFFSSALFVGGFGLLRRYPVLGGALFGILTFKPQLWLMVPIALLAARQWRALASAVAVALLIGILSLAVFNTEIWSGWLELMTGGSDEYRAWLAVGRINGMSVFACASLLGAPEKLASLCQAVAIVTAGGCVYWVFRRRDTGPLPIAALLAATILAAPHASASDAVLLGLAASLFLTAVMDVSLRPAHAIIAAAVWISPLCNPPSLFRIGLVTPVLLVIFLFCVISVLREKHRAAAPQASRT